ncbi:tryptophan-rich sensory protein [Hymenobacter koreensis]|uniref:Tryptophan-rich sensory protein n=1 Tax=Hymenobacter koreensis TaxID=1084523 RepID=A0ABP8IX23_9BACT
MAALAVLADIGVNYWWNAFPPNGQTMGRVSAKYPTLLTPAGYAFSIWGLIFLSLAAYSVWQLLPPQRRQPLADAVAQPLAVAAASTGAWVVAFSYEEIGVCMGLMLLALGALILAYGLARKLVLSGKAPAAASWPFALFLGWISVATVINATLVLRELDITSPPNITVLLTAALMAVVVVVGVVVSRVFQDWVYPLVLVWAFGGIWVARHLDVPELGWAALGGAVLLLISAAQQARAR